MTLIASIDCGDGVVFLSDGLLSSPEKKENVAIPTIAHLAPRVPVLGKNWIYGTTRKTIIINDGVMVAWAGNYLSAQRLLSATKEFVSNVTSDTAILEKHLLANHAEDLKRASIIVAARRSNSQCEVWASRCKTIRNSRGETLCFVVGSGSERFFELFKEFRMPDKVKGVNRSLTVAIQISALLLGEELMFDGPTKQGFGGHYDITYFDGPFTKHFSDITYIFWRAKVCDREVNLGHPVKALKSAIIEENSSYCYTIDFYWGGTGLKATNERYYFNGPKSADEFIKKIVPNNLKLLNSEHQAHVISFEENGKSHQMTCMTSSRENHPFCVLSDDTSIINYDKFAEIIRDFLIRRFPPSSSPCETSI